MAKSDLELGSQAIVECVLCDKPTTRDDVIEHLMETHEKVDLAVLVSLWWFWQDETPEGTDD